VPVAAAGRSKAVFKGLFICSKIMVNTWVEITETTPIPKQVNEFLVRNDNQGGTLKLVCWNPIHGHFQTKGGPLLNSNIGTHFFIIGL